MGSGELSPQLLEERQLNVWKGMSIFWIKLKRKKMAMKMLIKLMIQENLNQAKLIPTPRPNLQDQILRTWMKMSLKCSLKQEQGLLIHRVKRQKEKREKNNWKKLGDLPPCKRKES